MGNPEGLVSSGNLLQTALEARAALSDVNLLQTLHNLGHPYGVFVNQLFYQVASLEQSSSLSLVYSSAASENQTYVTPEPLTSQDISYLTSIGMFSLCSVPISGFPPSSSSLPEFSKALLSDDQHDSKIVNL